MDWSWWWSPCSFQPSWGPSLREKSWAGGPALPFQAHAPLGWDREFVECPAWGPWEHSLWVWWEVSRDTCLSWMTGPFPCQWALPAAWEEAVWLHRQVWNQSQTGMGLNSSSFLPNDTLGRWGHPPSLSFLPGAFSGSL